MSGLAVALLVVAGAGAAWAAWLVRAAQPQAERRADAVVILGARATAGKPSSMLRRRIDCAAEVLIRRPELAAVACGGTGTGERVSEAEVIGRELQARGIDAARIALEDRSTSTAENLAFALPILHGLAGRQRPRVLIATSDFHLARAKFLARALGIEPLSLPAATPRARLWRAALRELAAMAKAIAIDRPHLRRLRSATDD